MINISGIDLTFLDVKLSVNRRFFKGVNDEKENQEVYRRPVLWPRVCH